MTTESPTRTIPWGCWSITWKAGAQSSRFDRLPGEQGAGVGGAQPETWAVPGNDPAAAQRSGDSRRLNHGETRSQRPPHPPRAD